MIVKQVYSLRCTRCNVLVDIIAVFGGWVKTLDTAAEDCLCPGCLVLRVGDLEKEIKRLEEMSRTLLLEED